MNTKSTALATRNETVAGHTRRALPAHGIEVTTLSAINDATVHETPDTRKMIKAIGMLTAAPFIGLAFVVALPFIGVYRLAKLAREAYANKTPASSARVRKTMALARNIGLFFAAPFVALGYVIALPVVGSFMVARLALEARAKRAHAIS